MIGLAATETTNTNTSEFSENDYVPFVGLRRDAFVWNLIKKINLNETENFVISPFSIKVVYLKINTLRKWRILLILNFFSGCFDVISWNDWG